MLCFSKDTLQKTNWPVSWLSLCVYSGMFSTSFYRSFLCVFASFLFDRCREESVKISTALSLSSSFISALLKSEGNFLSSTRHGAIFPLPLCSALGSDPALGGSCSPLPCPQQTHPFAIPEANPFLPRYGWVLCPWQLAYISSQSHWIWLLVVKILLTYTVKDLNLICFS